MSGKFDLAKFAGDVEAAFFLIGGEKSKATYDWMIAAQERQRIIELLESKLTGRDNGLAYCYECGYWDDLYPEVIALIKGEQK